MKHAAVAWLHQWPPVGPAAFRIGRAGADLIAEWPGFGVLRAGPETTGEFTPGPDAPPHVRERLGEAVAALQRHLQGGITLHASSVAGGHHAVAFLGDSGSGKSTLAARLCAMDDVVFVSDDTTALQFEEARIEVAPTEGHHWLRPDVARMLGIDPGRHVKVPFEAARPAREPIALGAIVNLVFDDVSTPNLSRIYGVSAFSALSFSTFRFALDVPDVLKRELDHLARIARDVPIYELRRRRQADAMDACAAIVQDLLEELGKEAGVL